MDWLSFRVLQAPQDVVISPDGERLHLPRIS